MKLIHSLIVGALAFVAHSAIAATPGKRPLNLLFIVTDQQRWDAMSCAGNSVLKTPNLDRLAREGARFTSFYSACPVCVPARTLILTGHTNEANRVTGNNDIDNPDAAPFPSFDQILLRSGYKGEYHGKYHSPYKLAVDYTEPVLWLNPKNVNGRGENGGMRSLSNTCRPGRCHPKGPLRSNGNLIVLRHFRHPRDFHRRF